MGRQILNVPATPVLTFPLDGSDVNAFPTNKIPATASQVGFVRETGFGFAIAATPTTREDPIHMANGNETVLSVNAYCKVPGSASSVTIDIKKNGTTILAAPITITNASPAATKIPGSVSVVSLVDGDLLTAALTVSSSTGMSGLFVQIALVAAAAPL